MTTQQILFYIGIGLLALGALLAAAAAYLFFSRNIPDILDDLSGKKRADAIAAMSAESRGRRRRRAGDTGTLTTTGSGILTDAAASSAPTSGKTSQPTGKPESQPKAEPKPKSKPAKGSAVKKAAEPAKEDVTTVINDEEPATTVITGEAEATSVLTDETSAGVTTIMDAAALAAAAEDAEREREEQEAASVEEPSAENYAPEQWADEEEAIGPLEDEVPAEEPEPVVPEGFEIVRKIVLMESADFIRIERGDGYA